MTLQTGAALVGGMIAGIAVMQSSRFSESVHSLFDKIDRTVPIENPKVGGMSAFGTLSALWMVLYAIPEGGAVTDLVWLLTCAAIPLAGYSMVSSLMDLGVTTFWQIAASACGGLLSIGVYLAWLFNAGWESSMTDAASQQFILSSGGFVWFGLALAFATVLTIVGVASALEQAATIYRRILGRKGGAA